VNFIKSNFPRPTLVQAMLLAVIFLCSTIDMLQWFSIAGVSGLGAATLVMCGAVWALWLIRPVLPRGLLPLMLPLILFEIDAAGTFLWYTPRIQSIQLCVIGLSFLGMIMLTARESSENPRTARSVQLALLITSALPLVIYSIGLEQYGLGTTDAAISPRPWALYCMIIVAVALSMWRGNNWPETVRGQPSTAGRISTARNYAPVLWTVCIILVIGLSLSRTALVAALMLIPLSLAYRGSFRSLSLATLIFLVGAGVFAAAVYSYTPLYDRFFGEDASLQVGGVSFNGTGRSKIWNVLFTTIGDDWMFGKGVSASEAIIDATIPNIGQPHNDYLRFWYDQGVVGLSLWLIFILGYVYRTVGNLQRSIRNRSPDYPYHLAALLSLTAVLFSMLTDNPACYTFVMIPLAMVMGCSLGTADAANRAASVLQADHVFDPVLRDTSRRVGAV
jgi:O-antigen ligase